MLCFFFSAVKPRHRGCRNDRSEIKAEAEVELEGICMQRSTDRAPSSPLSASGELAETSEHLRELLRSFRKKFFASANPPEENGGQGGGGQ